jgi:hypothetical protein
MPGPLVLGKLNASTPRYSSMSTDGWPYEPGMSWRPPVVWFQLVTVSRLTVPPFLSSVCGPTWNSLRAECPP